jgi:hypothetical protein
VNELRVDGRESKHGSYKSSSWQSLSLILAYISLLQKITTKHFTEKKKRKQKKEESKLKLGQN